YVMLPVLRVVPPKRSRPATTSRSGAAGAAPGNAGAASRNTEGAPGNAQGASGNAQTDAASAAGTGGQRPATPLNGNAVAASASRLGLPIREIPASVDVVSQQQIREQGYRTTTETAQGAVGVLSGDAAGAPAGFSMRGFSYSEVNVLYNGISTGPQSITSRWMDT